MTILLDMNYAVISLPIELNLVCVRSTFLWAKFIKVDHYFFFGKTKKYH